MRTNVSTRSTRRAAGAAAGAAGLVLLAAVPASAHVTVSSPDAEPGGFGKLVFRVPNESADASVTRVSVQLPTDTPFASVSTAPVPGWTVSAEPTKLPKPANVQGATVTEAVTTVTWTAQQGNALKPHEFGEFALSVGPFPEKAATLSFPATQTYDDGEVVHWNQPVKPGTPEAQEPESPSPTLALAADPAVEPAAATGAEADAGNGDTVARTLSGVAVVLAAAALLRSLLAGRRVKS